MTKEFEGGTVKAMLGDEGFEYNKSTPYYQLCRFMNSTAWKREVGVEDRGERGITRLLFRLSPRWAQVAVSIQRGGDGAARAARLNP